MYLHRPQVDAPVHGVYVGRPVGIHHDGRYLGVGKRIFPYLGGRVFIGEVENRGHGGVVLFEGHYPAPCDAVHRIQQPEGMLAPDVGERHVAYIADERYAVGRLDLSSLIPGGVPEEVLI